MRAAFCLSLVLLSLPSSLLCAQPVEKDQPVRRIKLEEMQFADKPLGDKVRRLHAAAEAMAQPKWDRRPFESFKNFHARGVYYAEWCSDRDDDPAGPWNYHGPKEVNYITLGVWFDADKADPDTHKKIVGTRLDARWKPAGTGWDAKIEYSTFHGKPYPRTGGPQEQFNCRWYYYADGKLKKQNSTPRIELDHYGSAYFTKIYTFGQTEYTIVMHSMDSARINLKALADDDVRRIMATPESLRDHVVASYRTLWKRLSDEIGKNGGVYSAFYVPAQLPQPGKEPMPPMPSGRALTDADKQQILKDAKVEIDLKIATATEHCKALHEAARKAFPIREVLIEKK